MKNFEKFAKSNFWKYFRKFSFPKFEIFFIWFPDFLSRARDFYRSLRYAKTQFFNQQFFVNINFAPNVRNQNLGVFKIKFAGGHSGHFVNKLLSSTKKSRNRWRIFFSCSNPCRNMEKCLFAPSDWASHPQIRCRAYVFYIVYRKYLQIMFREFPPKNSYK